MFCLYYTAKVDKPNVWQLTGVLKSFEHLSFDRTIDKENSIFEFFVPEGNKNIFEEVLNHFVQKGIVSDFQLKENRLINSDFIQVRSK